MIPLQILGTGVAEPSRVVRTVDLAAEIGVDPEWAVAHTGVEERRWLGAGETALELGAEAVRRAVAEAGLTLGDVDVLLNASGSQLQPIPDGAALIAGALGWDGLVAYSLHGTCLSALAALQHAGLLIAAGQARHAVIVSTEGGSVGINPAQPESALLFGDGAAALVVGPATREGQGIVAHRWETHPAGAGTTEIRGGGTLLHPRDAQPEDLMFDMRGLAVLRLAHRLTPAFLEALRPGLSTGLPGVDLVVPHQASRAALQLMGRLGWDRERIVVTLPRVGNMIGASIPHALATARAQGRLEGAREILLVGTGAGLTLAGTILAL